MSDPRPFEIAGEPGGPRTATNGEGLTLTVLEGEAVLQRRRAIKGLSLNKPAGEIAIPLLNELATELLANGGMSTQQVAQRLVDMAKLIEPAPVQRVEWAHVRLDGVNVYATKDGDQHHVIVTRQDLQP